MVCITRQLTLLGSPQAWLRKYHDQMDPILEGLVTTTAPNGGPHLAPMGPRMLANERILLRPFPTSQTFQNLKRHGEGVLHVTDDVLLLAHAALNEVTIPSHRPAAYVRGFVLTD